MQRVPPVRAVDMCQQRTARGRMSVNEYRKYELTERVSIVQRQGCMRANEYRSTSCCHVSASYSTRTACARRYELLTVVSIIAPGPCTRNEVRKSELLACVSIIQLQACMRAQVRRQSYLRSKRVSQVRAVDMRQHHTAPGPCARNEFRKYEMFVCVSIVQLQACISAQVRRQGYMRSKRVLQVRAVDMRQHHTATGCMVINEYRKYEMSACVRIIQHEGASMSASTGCRHVSASCVVRVA